MTKKMQEKLAWIMATWFGSGLSPKAPGTVGSLCSVPLAFIGFYFGTTAFFFTICALFLIGWWATRIVLRTQKQSDPGFVVIDETIGQSLTFALVVGGPCSLTVLITGFLLFRLFDITKVWPASFFDRRVHTALGVMMDDVIAGLYAGVILYGLTLFL